jgi:hypothetical protein
MSNDLVAWVVAIGLGTVVVVVGMRRNLSETTRNNLPRFERNPELATAPVAPSEGERERKPLSLRQARWLASLYLLVALVNAADAVLSSDDRLLNVATAALFVLGAVVLVLRASRRPSGAPAS